MYLGTQIRVTRGMPDIEQRINININDTSIRFKIILT